MIQRADALTFHMTSIGASAWQKNAISVPLQFMTYPARVMEALTTSSLTKGERAKLAMLIPIMFGTGGAVADRVFASD